MAAVYAVPMNAQPDEVLYSREQGGPRVEILGPYVERSDEVLTPLALQLLASLQRRFNGRRMELLAARERRQAEFAAGVLPDFLPETAAVRAADWSIAPIPADLADRRFAVIGPADRKTVINALNAPLRAFTADFEDSCSPTWSNMIRGQVNLTDAIRRTITFSDAVTGKVYRLSERTATVVMRPRGLHLPEKHVRINGETVSGALFDFALFIANNHAALAQRGTGPVLLSAEARESPGGAVLERRVSRDPGSPRTATRNDPGDGVDRDDSCRVRDGRDPARVARARGWTQLRPLGLRFQFRQDLLAICRTFCCPDRAALGMEQHFLKSGLDLLTQTCQRRGAQAMGPLATARTSVREVFAGDLILGAGGGDHRCGTARIYAGRRAIHRGVAAR